ncbi:MAG: M48 family metalloprotease [Kineosporiaceae bacterium]|nr:M48 family metalloprotease [Kineosporiaceae bacterium]
MLSASVILLGTLTALLFTVAILWAAGRRHACSFLSAVTVAVGALPVLVVVLAALFAVNPHGHPWLGVLAAESVLALVLAVYLDALRRFVGLSKQARQQRLRHADDLALLATPHPGLDDVLVVPTDRDLAYLMCGSDHVVISRAVALRAEPAVRSVVEHERAHARGRHHVFSMAVAAASAALPLRRGLREFAEHVDRSLEAAADCWVVRAGLGSELSQVRRTWGRVGTSPAGAPHAEKSVCGQPVHPIAWVPSARDNGPPRARAVSGKDSCSVHPTEHRWAHVPAAVLALLLILITPTVFAVCGLT